MSIENLKIKEDKYKAIQEQFKNKCNTVLHNEDILTNLKNKLNVNNI